MSDQSLDEVVERAYRRHRDEVHGLCYRMTGSSSDAEDLAQATFVRLRERPPEDLESSLRGWLLQVAANLSRDHLRERKRVDYTGPWLPAPVEMEVDEADGWLSREHRRPADEDPESRIGELESVRYGFLVALEELTPDQRSVLLLRDVYDFSVRETAEALDLTESNVRVLHHRARERLPDDRNWSFEGDEELADETRELLESLMDAVVDQDAERLRELFTEDVRLLSDGGDYASATRPIEGPEDVAAFLVGLSKKGPMPDRVAWISVNGGPAILAEFDDPPPRQAPRILVRAEPGTGGSLRRIDFVMAEDKVGDIGRSD